MKNRIGGFFEFNNESLTLKENYLFNNSKKVENTYFTDSSRSSLNIILKTLSSIPNKEILLPDYCCIPGIMPTIISNKFEFKFYNIDELEINDEIILKEITSKTSIIILCNYFGLFHQYKCAEKIKKSFPKISIILDSAVDAYSILDSKFKNNFIDYEFTSLNKFFCIPDGSILRTKEDISSEINIIYNGFSDFSLASSVLMHLSEECAIKDNIYETLSLELNKIYTEKLNNNVVPRKMSLISQIIFNFLDLEKIKKIRRSNYIFFLENLKVNNKVKILKEKLNDNDAPLIFPIEFENQSRDEIREEMSKKNIFCPVYWPLDKYKGLPIGKFAKSKINNSLGLIIDQRYTDKELTKIVDILNKLQ